MYQQKGNKNNLKITIMKPLRTFAIITFKGGKTKKIFGYKTALYAIADFDNCIRVDIFKERHNNEAADLIDYAENI